MSKISLRRYDVEFDGYEVISADCDDWTKEWSLDDFDGDLDRFGQFADCVEDNGEAAELRFADWSGYDAHDVMDEYNGCWESAEEFVQNLIEDCYDFELPSFVYVDWERTARDVMMDYSSYEGSEGLHIWRD
jgi:antirestriction protein